MSSMSTSTDAFFALTLKAFFGSVPLMNALFPNVSEKITKMLSRGAPFPFSRVTKTPMEFPALSVCVALAN